MLIAGRNSRREGRDVRKVRVNDRPEEEQAPHIERPMFREIDGACATTKQGEGACQRPRDANRKAMATGVTLIPPTRSRCRSDQLPRLRFRWPDRGSPPSPACCAGNQRPKSADAVRRARRLLFGIAVPRSDDDASAEYERAVLTPMSTGFNVDGSTPSKLTAHQLD
jgi:hypothetical protein